MLWSKKTAVSSLPFARYFQAPEHQPFHLKGGQGCVLLVHGFPGSPAEMRPLGEALHQSGWTVEGMLLPGFGAQIDSLFERSAQEWSGSVLAALQRLKQQHQPVIALGFSMGAALVMQAAVLKPTDGLILMAPFWKAKGLLWNLLPLLRYLFPLVHPFRLIKVDTHSEEFRRGMSKFMPEVDPNDPAVQQGLYNFALPVGIFDEIRKLGLAAGRSAARLSMPTCVIQGSNDELVRPTFTRQLLPRFPGILTYQEVRAAHDLPQPDKPGWAMVRQSILDFAATLAEAPK